MLGVLLLLAKVQGAGSVDLLARSDWKLNGVSASPVAGGVRVAVNRNVQYGWAELRLPVDTVRTPVIRVEVAGASSSSKWTLKMQFPPRQEEWLITDNDQNGTFNFPIGEYLERYERGDCIVRFFSIGAGGAVTLKRLELLDGAAEGTTERVTIDEDQPKQTMDGGGGQADYGYWTIGKSVDRVSSQEIHTLVSEFKFDGVSVARVGAYGDVIQAASADKSDTRLKAVVHHIKTLKAAGIKTMFVAWFAPQATEKQKPKTDAWRDAAVAGYADFIEYCAQQGAPISYFELQNEPHSNKNVWTPDFLGQCGLALAKECEKRHLPVEIIGPDGMDDEWVAGWVKAMGDRARIVALKSGADKRGTREMTGHQIAAAIARAQSVSPVARRYWLTEYGCWAWGNPDSNRAAENGPCDGTRYGTAMAELTHYYLAAGIACPSIWELSDVRRIDEVAGKSPPEPPKRWGMVKYKTENWAHRAHFDTLGHYYRALQPGTRVYASSSSGGLLPTAVKTADGWRLVLFNRFGYAKGAEVRLPSGNWGGRAWWVVTDPERTTRMFPLETGASVSVGLPPYGIGTLVLGPKTMPKVTLPPQPMEPALPDLAKLKAAPLSWNTFEPGGPATKMAFDAADSRFVSRTAIPADFTMRLRVRLTHPEEYEISPVLGFGASGYQQLKLRENTAQLWSSDGHALSERSAIEFAPTAATHDLVIEKKADRLTLWIDGKYFWDYEMDDLAAGPAKLGLRGHGFEVAKVEVFPLAVTSKSR